MFDRLVTAADRAIRKTSTEQAPWHIVEGEDHHYRSIVVATAIRDAIRHALEATPVAASQAAPVRRRRSKRDADTALEQIEQEFNVLDKLDMEQHLSRQPFKTAIEEQQSRLNLLQRKAAEKGISTIVVLEGWDAAGKGGAIRRITAALDARDYQVTPIAAPTDEERARHYLWRFWRHLPRAGRMTIFDRSWYGRVLVERVEGFATEAEWRRAYAEITSFEEHLLTHGLLVVKFWIHITADEQVRRFRDRLINPLKRWKLSYE